MEPEALLSIRGLHKAFAAPVLSDVSLDLAAGEVHALLGANGAGKTTLARIVAGLLPADRGDLRLDGAPYAPADKHGAEQRGIHIIQQELNLIGTLSVAENLFLSRLPSRGGFVRRRALHDEARRALAAVGLADLDPATPAGSLGIGRQQMVEIASALSRRCRVLILDEPTAALTDPQIALLFEHILRLKRAGVGMIYISHRLEEIRRIADRATVLRDGRVVGAGPIAEFDVERMVRLMAGRPATAAAEAARAPGDVALRVEDLVRRPAVRGVSFEARRGEILGIAGLVGSGRTELLRAVYGADPPDSGAVRVGEATGPGRFRNPADAARAGLAMIPEDRKRDGLLLRLPIRVNLTLGSLPAFARRGGWLAAGREAEAAERECGRMDVRRSGLEQPVEQLSGGNQQKVVIGRWLMRDAQVFLFDEPTRGIDVAAKAAIHRLLGDLAARGRAVVVVSSELDELMTLCDRIVVMSAGRLTAEFRRGEGSREQIMSAAFEGYMGRGGAA